MNYEEIYSIVLAVKGEEEAKRLVARARELEVELKDLDGAYGRGVVQANNYAQALRSIESQQKRLNKDVEGMGQTLKASNEGWLSNRNNVQRLGYALDDVQYVFQNGMGLRPIINNLFMFSAYAGAAALAVDLLYRHWDEISSLWGKMGTKTEAERMEELGKQINKTAEEAKKYRDYERLQANINTQAGGLTQAQTAQQKGVNEAIAEGGIDNVVKGMVQGRIGNDLFMKRIDAQEKKSFEKNRDLFMRDIPDEDKAKFATARANRANQLDANARARLGKAASDPDILRSVIQEMNANPAAFGKDQEQVNKMRAGLLGALPENSKEYKPVTDSNAKEYDANLKRIFGAKGDPMSGEMAKDITKVGKAEADRSKKLRDEREKETEARDRENMAGLRGSGGLLEALLKGAMKDGASGSGIAGMMENIKDELMAAGMGGTEATKMLMGARDKAESDRQTEMLDKAFPTKVRNSQMMGALEMSAALQGGVSNENAPQKMLNEQIKTNAKMDLLIAQAKRRVVATVN